MSIAKRIVDHGTHSAVCMSTNIPISPPYIGGREIVKPHRRLVKQGKLSMQLGSTEATRVLLLFNDVLLVLIGDAAEVLPQ